MHPNTKLTLHSWSDVVRRIESGASVTDVSRNYGISRQRIYIQLRRYRAEGSEGLKERSSRPHRSPRRLSPAEEEQILEERRRSKDGPDVIALRLRKPASTVYVVLKRHGLSREPRAPRAPARRYEHEAPGSMMHVDFKELAGIGGGKRYQFSMVDDHTRETYADILERATTVAAADAFERGRMYFLSHGVRIKRVLTDNGMQFTMRHTPHPDRRTKFEHLLAKHGIKHVKTRPYSPQTNGKVERFHRTVQEGLYDVFHFDSEAQRRQALAVWLRRYNTQRLHTALGGLTPAQRREQFFRTLECQQCA